MNKMTVPAEKKTGKTSRVKRHIFTRQVYPGTNKWEKKEGHPPSRLLLCIETSSQGLRTSSWSVREEEKEVKEGDLRLVAMGVEVLGCCAHRGHGRRPRHEGTNQTPKRQERWTGFHSSQGARLDDASDVQFPQTPSCSLQSRRLLARVYWPPWPGSGVIG